MDKLKALLKSVFSIKGLFVSVLSLIVIVIIYMITVVSISPKYEGKDKGFVACSTGFLNCLGEYVEGSSYQKVVGAVECSVKNISCDVNIIKKGFALWHNGKKNTPWELYLQSDVSDALKEYDKEAKAQENAAKVQEKPAENIPVPCDSEPANKEEGKKSDFCPMKPSF